MPGRRLLRWALLSGDSTPGIPFPSGARVLSVGYRGEALNVWVETPQPGDGRTATFHAFETGQFVSEALTERDKPEGHVGTAEGAWRGQPYVAHVYLELDS